jgi:hypothetical protein
MGEAKNEKFKLTRMIGSRRPSVDHGGIYDKYGKMIDYSARLSVLL